MQVAGLQKLTLLDYPGKTAATVFTPGCNFRCPFCHNADLVLGHPSQSITPDDVLTFLDKRQGLLDGVCITGGEPLLQPGLADFCKRIHERGFHVKLDTNGSFPDRLQALMEADLVDYVAMDIKNAPTHYAETIGVSDFDLTPVRSSIELLLTGTVPFEFRTTVVRELHTPDNLRDIARWIAKAPAWFLQTYVDADSVLAGQGTFHAWPDEQLRSLLPELQAIAPAAHLRGVDQ